MIGFLCCIKKDAIEFTRTKKTYCLELSNFWLREWLLA